LAPASIFTLAEFRCASESLLLELKTTNAELTIAEVEQTSSPVFMRLHQILREGDEVIVDAFGRFYLEDMKLGAEE
jgi:hypothetical protein